ncbi:MAG: hypothetical protein DRJ51_08325 [Thermoprotei archaeon]|nr:MAG: hypothetical protein DRJ51_08325 [Thermoprotei archaeon]
MGEEKAEKIILWFEELTREDVPLVGSKCANLGEMMRIGIPVPSGFAVSAYAYKRFLEETGVGYKINIVLKKIIKGGGLEEYREVSKRIRRLIEDTPIPRDIEEGIREAYRELCRRAGREEYVAVRSSATAEDLLDASFAGQHETYLNVIGEDEVIKKVQKCWSSLFTPRAIFYREQRGLAHEEVLMSVAVQKMVNARTAGVMFTIHPVTGEEDKILIEGSWGLGEAVVSGAVTPDEWVVDKKTLEIIERRIAEKVIEYIRNSKTGRTVHAEVPLGRRKTPCLTDEEVKKLAKLGIRIEKHYRRPQDIEWAIDRDLPFPNNVFIVQSRAETVWSVRKGQNKKGKDMRMIRAMRHRPDF